MIGISKIGDFVEGLNETMPLTGKTSGDDAARRDGGGANARHEQQPRRQGSPAPSRSQTATNPSGPQPAVDAAVRQLGTDVRARIFASLGASQASGGDLHQGSGPRIQGSGRAGDRNKYIYRNGRWFNVATGEPAAPIPSEAAAGETAPAASAVLAGPVSGTGRSGDLNRYIFRDGNWYNLATGQPGAPATPALGDEASEPRHEAPVADALAPSPAAPASQDAANAAALFHRLGFDPLILTLPDNGFVVLAIARAGHAPGLPAPANPSRSPVLAARTADAGRRSRLLRADAAFRDKYAEWIGPKDGGRLGGQPVYMESGTDFAAAWHASPGSDKIAAETIQGFMHPQTREIHIRQHASPAVNAAYRETILQDLAQSYRCEIFATIFGAYRLNGDAGASLGEAAAEYIAYKLYAGEAISAAPGGYAAYQKQKGGARRTTQAEIACLAESAFEAMGPELDRAFFLGDPAAMARLAALARSIDAIKIPGTFRAETGSGAAAPSSSAERLSDLLHRVAADGRDVSPRSIHRHHRRPDALQNVLPDWDAPMAALRRIHDAAQDRPQGASMHSLTMRAPGVPLLTAMLDGTPPPGYTLFRAADDGFHFTRAGAAPESIAQRISINARQAHAGDLLDFIIREILDNPHGFPGVIAAKISGPFAGASRTDNIVLYLETDRDRSQVLGQLARYERGHPAHLLAETPKLTMPYLPGISFAEEPTPAMKRNANAIFRAERLPGRNADSQGFGALRAHAIHLAFRDAKAAPGTAAFADAFRWKVWERFVQFGINPDEPSLNLRSAPGEA